MDTPISREQRLCHFNAAPVTPDRAPQISDEITPEQRKERIAAAQVQIENGYKAFHTRGPDRIYTDANGVARDPTPAERRQDNEASYKQRVATLNQAVKHFSNAIALAPTAEAHFGRGFVNYNLGFQHSYLHPNLEGRQDGQNAYAQAATDLTSAIGLADPATPGFTPQEQQERVRLYVQCLLYRGRAHQASGSNARARMDWETALAAAERFTPVPEPNNSPLRGLGTAIVPPAFVEVGNALQRLYEPGGTYANVDHHRMTEGRVKALLNRVNGAID